MTVIKKLRKSLGLSQIELAKALNVHQTAVSQWENNKTNPDMGQAIRLSIFFNVSTDYILGRTDDPTPPSHSKPHLDEDEALNELYKATDLSHEGQALLKHYLGMLKIKDMQDRNLEISDELAIKDMNSKKKNTLSH